MFMANNTASESCNVKPLFPMQSFLKYAPIFLIGAVFMINAAAIIQIEVLGWPALTWRHLPAGVSAT
jgi:hypothetical protein